MSALLWSEDGPSIDLLVIGLEKIQTLISEGTALYWNRQGQVGVVPLETLGAKYEMCMGAKRAAGFLRAYEIPFAVRFIGWNEVRLLKESCEIRPEIPA